MRDRGKPELRNLLGMMIRRRILCEMPGRGEGGEILGMSEISLSKRIESMKR